MEKPDTTQTSSQSISIAFPAGIFVLILILALFQYKDSIPSFQVVLWAGTIILSFIVSTVLFIMAQYIRCNKIDGGKAIKGGAYTVATMTAGLLISSLSWFRVPVASVFAPLFVKTNVDVTLSPSQPMKNTNTASKCCMAQQSLEALEQQYSLLEGLSYGFYSFFGMMFGIVIGNGTATAC
jgi:hypothetical protein